MTIADQIGVLHYGVGNTGSLTRALDRAGGDVCLVTSPDQVLEMARVVLPGVGSFSAAMLALENQGWVETLLKYAASGRPIMGICLGMQLLMESGEEGGLTRGLGLIAGETTPLPSQEGLKLPHMGWNSMEAVTDHPILMNVRPHVDYYFAHSYVVAPRDSQATVAVTMHGNVFPSVIARDNVLGIQFHPEKSPPMGHKLLLNFLSWGR